jgi:hypothetical protein
MTALRLLIVAVLCLATARAATNSPLRALGVISSYGDSAQIFDRSTNLADLDHGVGFFLARTLDACRSNAAARGQSPQSIASMSGWWLEWATLVALKQNQLLPAYWQAEFVKLPDNFNDVMLWSKEHGPVILSCKTSLRERYKQADLEAVALRQFFPDAKFFLLTLDADKRHVARTRKKIADGELLAVQAIYDETNADELFAFLRTLTLSAAPDGVLRRAKIVR